MINNNGNNSFEEIFAEIDNAEHVFIMPKPKRTISETLTPTFENVSREFIYTTIKNIILGKAQMAFNFIFTQKEAIEFIEEVLIKALNNYFSDVFNFKTLPNLAEINNFNIKDYYKKELYNARTIIDTLKDENQIYNDFPSLIIKDYVLFFELLRQYYEKDIELFYERTGDDGFQVYEMLNLFEEIWLRATPEDFNNPIAFLKKQIQLIIDETLHKYKNETFLGELEYFDNNIIGIKTIISRPWDETPFELKIALYNKEEYTNNKLYMRPNINLSNIRYGFYEKNGEKICVIGAIQKKSEGKLSYNKLKIIYEKLKYKIFKGVQNINTYDVEPSKLISLIIFIILLQKEGITEIEIPGLYSLDYQYHEKRNITLKNNFEKKWTEYLIEKKPEHYEEEKKELEDSLNKEDSISKNKTENLIKLFLTLANYFPGLIINSYPSDCDNLFRITIPVINNESEINGELAKELYFLVNNFYNQSEMKL